MRPIGAAGSDDETPIDSEHESADVAEPDFDDEES